MKVLPNPLITALAIAALLLLATWIWSSREGPRTTGTSAGETNLAKAVENETELAPVEASAQRVPQTAPGSEASPKEMKSAKKQARSPTVVRHRGQTLDIRGGPVSGVRVGTQADGKVLAASDALGFFEIDLTESPCEVVALDAEWVTVRYDLVRASDLARAHFLIVAPPLSLAGKVVDSAGRALARASVRVDIPIGAFAGFPLALDSTGLESFATKSGADGSFDLNRAPAIPKAWLVTSYPKLQADTRPLPGQSVADLYIELKEPLGEGAFLEGMVVHEDDKPAPGARVLLGNQETIADGEGRFRMPLASTDPETPLAAILQGFQPAVMPEYGRVLESTDRHPPPVRLVLGPPPLSISGHVIDADGKPAPRWTVTLLLGTALSRNRIPVITAERLTAIRDAQVVTAKDGSFRIGGLRDIQYRLQAWNEEGLLIQSPALPAGTKDAVLQVPPDSCVEKISGRVLSRDGLPLSDISVWLVVVTERTGYGSAFQNVKSVRTKTDGSFEMKRVPKHLARLSVMDDSIQNKDCELDEVDLTRPVEIVVERMCRFRFESETNEGAPDAIAVLNVEGEMLGLVTRDAGGMSSMNIGPLTDGRSHVMSVTEEAARLVLYRNGDVISSQPLHLAPGEINIVHREP